MLSRNVHDDRHDNTVAIALMAVCSLDGSRHSTVSVSSAVVTGIDETNTARVLLWSATPGRRREVTSLTPRDGRA
jgi:hypothetical protein